jgi:hypothetical protein
VLQLLEYGGFSSFNLARPIASGMQRAAYNVATYTRYKYARRTGDATHRCTRVSGRQPQVTRPGLSAIASSYAVELTVSLLHHPHRYVRPQRIVPVPVCVRACTPSRCIRSNALQRAALSTLLHCGVRCCIFTVLCCDVFCCISVVLGCKVCCAALQRVLGCVAARRLRRAQVATAHTAQARMRSASSRTR